MYLSYSIFLAFGTQVSNGNLQVSPGLKEFENCETIFIVFSCLCASVLCLFLQAVSLPFSVH